MSDKIETISWESEAKRSKLLEWKFGQRKYHRKCFSSYLELKNQCCKVWKEHFSVFCWFLSDEFETIFWKSEGKNSKLFQSKFSHKKLLRKWFWSYLELRKECCEPVERAFYSFASFCVTKLTSLSGKVKQSVQSYLNQGLVIERFLENGFEATWRSIMNVVSVWKGRFSIFCKF